MLKHIFLYLYIFIYSCTLHAAGAISTTKIKLYFGEDRNQSRYIIEDPNNFDLYLKFNFDSVASVSIDDVSQQGLHCTPDISPSPAHISTFRLEPPRNLKDIKFRIQAPCAAYHEKLKLKVSVKSGNQVYYQLIEIPVAVSKEGPGYFRDNASASSGKL